MLGSGNLGLVYVPGPERLTLEDLEARWPELVPGLAGHPGIGFVAALGNDGPVAIGARAAPPRDRSRRGSRPADPVRAHAAAMLLSATLMKEAPDLYVNSSVDPDTLDVAAFEPLVGCHGGLGGWQDRGFVVAPPDLLQPTSTIVGGEQLHRHLVDILESLGHRADLVRSTP